MRNLYYLFSVKDKLFTELTQILHRKKLFDAYYGLAYANHPVLKNNLYAHVSYVTDITKREGEIDYAFLEKIEATYDINISAMLHTDRHLSRYNKKKRLFVAQELIRLLINEIQTFAITHVYPEGVDDFISFFAAIYCKHHHITFFYPIEVGYAERACFASTPYPEPDQFREVFQEALHAIEAGKMDTSLITAEITQYIDEKKKPKYYMGVNEADYRTLKLKDIKIFFQYCLDYLRDISALPYERFPLFLPFYRLKKIIRRLSYKHFLKTEAISLDALKNQNYLIYPLHFEPEASTLIQGRWLNDQRKIIEIISKSMPINTLLLVKEHRISIGRRELKFYKDIVQYHNVFFVDDKIDTYPFIAQSKGVIVISSTMGLEALLMKKPVLSFGERFYTVSKNVYVAENIRMIDKQIQSMLKHTFYEDDCLALVYALLATTKNLGTLCHFAYTHQDLELLANEIEQVYG